MKAHQDGDPAMNLGKGRRGGGIILQSPVSFASAR